jgi:hypothetical protein
MAIKDSERTPVHLGLDDRFTCDLKEFFEGPGPPRLVSADVAVAVQYQIPIIHLKREKMFPLFAAQQHDGIFRWYPHALPN